MRTLFGLAIGLLAGGILGYYQVFCPGGTCPLTGTWLGGALIGGILGSLLMGGGSACAGRTCRPTEPSTHPKGKPS